MNLLNLVWVNQVFGTDDAAVWNHLGCIELLLTELRPPIAIYVAIMIRCNLYEIKWQFALLEISAPLSNEVGKTFGILAVRVAHVRTSLIEENTLYAIVEDRVESSVTPEKRVEEIPLKLRVLGHLYRVEIFLGVLLQVVAVEPAFYTASTLVCHDQTYRNIKSLVYYLCKEVSCSRCIAYRLWIDGLPFAVGVIKRFAAHHTRNLYIVNSLVLISFKHRLVVSFNRAVAESLYGHLHVALTCTNPYFSCQHIVESGLFAIIESDGERGVARLWGLYFDCPFAIFSGLCRIFLSRP